MSTTARAPQRAGSAPSVVRRVIGFVLLALVVVTAVLFALGAWNPWQYAALKYSWFGNPMRGLLVVPALAFLALWLALPITQEARQRVRIAARATAGVFVILGVFAYGVFGTHFTFTAEPVATSPDGTYTAALVRDRDRAPNTYVRIWRGSGLTAREVSDLGRVCGTVRVAFVDNHQVAVRTAYGAWRFDLDPETGESLQVLGARCSSGPVPR
jgi:hypothetical protein